ncbi:MAG: hypothetical protein ACLFPX_05730 [Candidatus Omnitrophota bacterium]
MKKAIMCLMLALMIGALPVSVMAKEYGGGSMMGKGKGYGGMSCASKVYKKADLIKEYQEKIGVSDEKVKEVRQIRSNLKKTISQKKSQVETVMVDIEDMLDEDAVDVKKVNSLIDKKYEAKKEKMKAEVKAYADLKNALSEDQMKKLKKVWKEEYGGMKKGMMHEGKRSMGQKKRSMGR